MDQRSSASPFVVPGFAQLYAGVPVQGAPTPLVAPSVGFGQPPVMQAQPTVPVLTHLTPAEQLHMQWQPQLQPQPQSFVPLQPFQQPALRLQPQPQLEPLPQPKWPEQLLTEPTPILATVEPQPAPASSPAPLLDTQVEPTPQPAQVAETEQPLSQPQQPEGIPLSSHELSQIVLAQTRPPTEIATAAPTTVDTSTQTKAEAEPAHSNVPTIQQQAETIQDAPPSTVGSVDVDAAKIEVANTVPVVASLDLNSAASNPTEMPSDAADTTAPAVPMQEGVAATKPDGSVVATPDESSVPVNGEPSPATPSASPMKRKRGRPPKPKAVVDPNAPPLPKRRGRPPKARKIGDSPAGAPTTPTSASATPTDILSPTTPTETVDGQAASSFLAPSPISPAPGGSGTPPVKRRRGRPPKPKPPPIIAPPPPPAEGSGEVALAATETPTSDQAAVGTSTSTTVATDGESSPLGTGEVASAPAEDTPPAKRRRGRPPKDKPPVIKGPPKKRGRPRKSKEGYEEWMTLVNESPGQEAASIEEYWRRHFGLADGQSSPSATNGTASSSESLPSDADATATAMDSATDGNASAEGSSSADGMLVENDEIKGEQKKSEENGEDEDEDEEEEDEFIFASPHINTSVVEKLQVLRNALLTDNDEVILQAAKQFAYV